MIQTNDYQTTMDEAIDQWELDPDKMEPFLQELPYVTNFESLPLFGEKLAYIYHTLSVVFFPVLTELVIAWG